MSYVDFRIGTIKTVDAIQLDSVVEVTAYMYRGHYEMIEDAITKELVNTYIRDEKFGEALIIFVPNNASELEINKQLYYLLLEEKLPNDEVITECVF